MHYHNEFLVRADTSEDAKKEVDDFLNSYRDKEWDWYEQGGRWEQFHHESLKDKVKKVKAVLRDGDLSILFVKDYKKEVLDIIRFMMKEKQNETIDFGRIFRGYKKEGETDMAAWAKRKKANIEDLSFWCNDTMFWDLEAQRGEMPKHRWKEILEKPNKYWLLTYDLHN